jgi:hypothetical protein
MKKNLKRIIFTTSIYLVITFLFHYLFYRLSFELDSISNTLFYVGITSFFSGLIGVTNAQNVFIGFRYFIVQKFQRKDNSEYLSYSEYNKDKIRSEFTYVSVLILIIGIGYIVGSIYLALLWFE